MYGLVVKTESGLKRQRIRNGKAKEKKQSNAITGLDRP